MVRMCSSTTERRATAGYGKCRIAPRWAERLHYDRPIGEAIAVVRAVRSASLALLESLTEDEWHRSGRHAESGPYGVERWLEIYAEHPHEHAAQIRAARG